MGRKHLFWGRKHLIFGQKLQFFNFNGFFRTTATRQTNNSSQTNSHLIITRTSTKVTKTPPQGTNLTITTSIKVILKTTMLRTTLTNFQTMSLKISRTNNNTSNSFKVTNIKVANIKVANIKITNIKITNIQVIREGITGGTIPPRIKPITNWVVSWG